MRFWNVASDRHVSRLAAVLSSLGLLSSVAPVASPAFASPPDSDVVLLLQTVLHSAAPNITLAHMSAADQTKIRTGFAGLHVLATSTHGGPIRQPAERVLGQLTSREALSHTAGCWYRYWYYAWGNFGIVMAHTWMTLNWCSNGVSVTTYSLGATGGTASFPGLSYGGIAGQGGLNVGWEIRYYAEFKFTAGFLSTTPCQQIRGGSTGLYSQRDTCNLN